MLLVHDFSPSDPAAKLAKDLAEARADLDAFVRLLAAGPSAHMVPATVTGPFTLFPTTYVPSGVQLYVGKAVTSL